MYIPYRAILDLFCAYTKFLMFFLGGNNKKSSPSQNNSHGISTNIPLEVETSKSSKVLDHGSSSGFGTKDSSDSKSHDSGIDSIEKPGKTVFFISFVRVFCVIVYIRN